MAYVFGSRSLSRAKRVDPVLMDIARLALARSSVDFGLTEEQSRTKAQQRAKVEAGVSKTMDSAHMIQDDGWSKGLDLVPWVNGAFSWGDKQWRVQVAGVGQIFAFHEIALAMRSAALEVGRGLVWGAIWDRQLTALKVSTVDELRAKVEAYKVRHAGADFLDGPHFQLAKPW